MRFLHTPTIISTYPFLVRVNSFASPENLTVIAAEVLLILIIKLLVSNEQEIEI